METRTEADEPLLSYALPTILIALAVIGTIWLPDWFQVAIPLVALASGFAFRPRHVWIIWAASTLVFLTVLGSLYAVDYDFPKMSDEEQTTLGSYAVAVLLYTAYSAALALLPLWLGRSLWNKRHQDGKLEPA